MAPTGFINTKRLTRNTLLLYCRMLLCMAISLYTSRIVLNMLGVENFGIYNVVGGIVILSGCVSRTLSSVITRFLNIELGRGDTHRLRGIFSSAVIMCIFLSVLVVVMTEIVGQWFIVSEMTIPDERVPAAIWTLHFSLAAFVIQLMSIPYNACIIAHEDMKVFAYIGILEAGLKLLIAGCLIFAGTVDRLILYGMLLFGVSVIIRFVYWFWCRKNYKESRFRWQPDKLLIKEMLCFGGWNMLGSSSSVLSDQGVNLLLNVFCSPIVNAARGIAMQVNGIVSQFAGNFMTALDPQIMKSYGANELENYKKLMLNGSRLAVGLLMILSLPILMETPYIIQLWLGQVPEYTVSFVRLVLVFGISEAMAGPFITGLLSTGKIKSLMVTVSALRMVNLPISYFILHLWNMPELTILSAIGISQASLYVRLFLLKKTIDISINYYIGRVVFPVVLIMGITCLLCHQCMSLLAPGILHLCVVTVFCFMISSVLIAALLITKTERKYIYNWIQIKIGQYVKKGI